MRGDIVYCVYGLHEGREEDTFFGAFRSRNEAENEIKVLRAKDFYGQNWAERYHNKGFIIREATVDTDFEIPTCPKPRDKFCIKTTPKPNRPGTWDSTIVEVFRREASSERLEKLCEYVRNYSMLQTFEPFRQGAREYALISRHYQKTAVLDLATGSVVAEEGDGVSSVDGFCPVGFYVPDWWDINDGRIIPGGKHWDTDLEWPVGKFGFVWGCIWGDDSSWKVQYLDLTGVHHGVIKRDDRFGYVELSTSGFKNPCLKVQPPDLQPSKPPSFIRVTRNNGTVNVTFAVEMAFDLDSGATPEWLRLKIANME